MTVSLCAISFIPCDVPGAVRRNARTAAATDAEVENEIKYWLKFAAERDGSRQRRTQVQVTPGTSVQ